VACGDSSQEFVLEGPEVMRGCAEFETPKASRER